MSEIDYSPYPYYFDWLCVNCKTKKIDAIFTHHRWGLSCSCHKCKTTFDVVIGDRMGGGTDLIENVVIPKTETV